MPSLPIHSFLLCVLCASAVSTSEAGDLNPPAGAVTPTMKTLQQVEPRTPVSAATTPGDATTMFLITQPGSYYLTGNITADPGKHGITIAGGSVTLDLMGFTLRASLPAPNFHGVFMPSFANAVIIQNGTVTGWGGFGIRAQMDTGRIERIVAVGNTAGGIDNSGGTYTTHIIACEGSLNVGPGIGGGEGSLIESCLAQQNQGDGIRVGPDSQVRDCNSSANQGDGIETSARCTVAGNTLAQNGASTGANIRVLSGQTLVENNSCSSAQFGIFINGTDCIVRGNHVTGNIDNYNFTQGNALDLILSDLPEIIDWPARLTLARTLTRLTVGPGISINASDVTLDLAGYALVGNNTAGAASDGVAVASAVRNITIRDGELRAWGDDGIDAGQAVFLRLDQVRSASNLGDGFVIGSDSSLRNCTARTNGAVGFSLGFRAKAEECASSGNTGSGFSVNADSVVRRCESSDDAVHGFLLTSRCRAESCTARSAGMTGILGASTHVSGVIEGCYTVGCGTGFRIIGTGWTVVRNMATANTTNYFIGAGNHAGDIIATPGTADPYDNLSN